MKFLPSMFVIAATALSSVAHAYAIDFNSEPNGLLLPGYTIEGVQFFNMNGSSNQIRNGELSTYGDSSMSGIRMRFPGAFDYIALDFGNDDPRAGYTWGLEAVVMLALYNEQGLAADIRINPNADDLTNETIRSSGVLFDEAVLRYMLPRSAPGGQGVYVAEVMDNLVFSRGAPTNVPEPSTLALLALAIGGLQLMRRPNIRTPS